jgi:predicted DNA-binding transcriptional regulator AlpA
MTEYNFTLILDGDVEDHVDELFDAGLDDALLGETNGIAYAEFDREAPSLLEAITEAIGQVRSVPGIAVSRVEPEDYVTAAEIASQTGKSREAIRLLAAGKRGSGSFPRPYLRVRNRSPLWRRSEILAWTSSDPETQADAAAIGLLNAQLEIERLSHTIPKRQLAILQALQTSGPATAREVSEILPAPNVKALMRSLEEALQQVRTLDSANTSAHRDSSAAPGTPSPTRR